MIMEDLVRHQTSQMELADISLSPPAKQIVMVHLKILKLQFPYVIDTYNSVPPIQMMKKQSD